MLEDNPNNDRGGLIPHQPSDEDDELIPQGEIGGLEKLWDFLVRIGLGEPAYRVGSGFLSVVLFLVVIWLMSNYYLGSAGPGFTQTGQAQSLANPTPTEIPLSEKFIEPVVELSGVVRKAQIHTSLPSRPRYEVVEYTVIAGDSLFGIADKFNLQPETILWGNLDTLGDNPHLITPGMVLNILPVDGVYHKWSAGEGLNGVSEYYGVTPEDIIDWPGNHLSKDTIGDYTKPNIEPGTYLVVPGGKREFSSWATPRITRGEAAKARNLGPGYCGEVYTGVIGSGNFIFPAPHHYLSGYDYSPSTNHFGLDFDGVTGDPISASDNGVIVYAGWNNYGYGNMVVIDHGNGWQTLYAHLDSVNVVCGESVYQGTTIGLMGSTGASSGSHLHFEMYNDDLGKVNPWNFLN